MSIMTFNKKELVGADLGSESAHQITFVSWLQYNHPLHRSLLIHKDNENRIRSKKDWGKLQKDIKMGSINKGMPDILILTKNLFAMDIKDLSKKAVEQEHQVKRLELLQEQGFFVCFGYGFEGCKMAFNYHLENNQGGKDE